MKFIHIHIPKTGGTSVSVALGGSAKPDHRTALAIKQNTPDWDSYFKFTFVRNPWDLVVSDFFARSKNRLDSLSLGEIKSKFKEYVMHIHRWDSQCSFFLDSGNLLVDFIGRFEIMPLDFGYICHKLGVENKLEHLNSSNHKHYTVYYDDETIEKVASIFKEDIQYLHYGY